MKQPVSGASGDPTAAAGSSKNGAHLLLKPTLRPYLIASVLLLLLAAWLIRTEFRQQREHAAERVMAVSELRQAQVDAWVGDLLGQARFLGSSAYWAELFQRMQAGDQASRDLLIARMIDWRKDHNSDSVLLLGADGLALAREHAASRETAPELQAAAHQALATGAPVLTGIYRRENTEIPLRLDLVIPLARTGQPAQGAVVLRTDAKRWLFPTLHAWPVPTQTGETALWRRDGEQMVLMNELRTESTSAGGHLRRPLHLSKLPPASLERAEQPEGQVFEGRDYRDTAVMAVGRRVNGTDWWMVTKIDLDEVDRGAHRSAGWIALGAALALGILAALARLQLQQESLRELEQVRIRERQFRQLIEATPEATVIVDEAGAIALINHRAEELFGYQQAELVGQAVEILVPPELRAHHVTLRQGYMSSLQRKGIVMRGNLSAVDRKGRVFPADLSLSVANWGAERRFVTTIIDVTERKQAEAALLDYQDNLERLVAGRTQELADTTERLREAKEAAEAANHAKSAFLSNMSHELRTPMNAIMGMSYLLQAGPLNPQQQRQLKTIQTASQQLLGLIDDILTFTSLEAGAHGTAQQDFELPDLLDSAASRIREQANAKGLKLAVEIAPDLPLVLHGDAAQIGEVLHKLADNAVKFTPAGSVCLRVAAAGHQGSRVMLRFEVQDSGIGLSAEEQILLFQTFEQVDSSSTRQYGGTGLGLALARRLVELMGGQIGVESEKGRGSRFWFTLPLLACAAPPAETSATT